MSGSGNEDQEQRINPGTEDSNEMTIEFLRARLLSERSVSKSARQRADELAKRVFELEDQLKFVSIQRKKAEKATADVLAILENHGISDVSEEFDSCSDDEETPHDLSARNGSVMTKEASTNIKMRKNEYFSSEIESSRSTGRSLSWKSTKDSQFSFEKKKYLDSVRRRASSFASNSSSARRVGKSVRKIRRRETRSVEDLQNDYTENDTCSRDFSNCSDGEPVALGERAGHDNEKNPPENQSIDLNSETQKGNGHYVSGHERDEDMESALRHQAQLIGKYEAEEKVQREWEEKFRENNSVTQDSCDPGIHSDVTEEQYEIKSPAGPSHSSQALNSNNQETRTEEWHEVKPPGPSYPTRTSNSNNQEQKQGPLDAHSNGQLQTPNISLSPQNALKGNENSRGATIACESEFSFPTSKEKTDQETSRNHQELAVVPRETSTDLGSVLEALHRAKSSLNQKLNNRPVKQPDDLFNIPVYTPALFRLPTNDQFEETTITTHPRRLHQSTFANSTPEIASARYLSENGFITVPHRPFVTEIGSSGGPPQRSLSQPRLSEGPQTSNRMNLMGSYTSPLFQSVQNSYPFLPDITLRYPSSEGASRSFPSSENGLPPVTRLSMYDDRFGPNMYR